MSGAALDTPPSSDVGSKANLPPSPPLSPAKSTRATRIAVDRVLSTLRLHRKGQIEGKSDWKVSKLPAAEYPEFEARLRKEPALHDWFKEELRYDWEAEAGRLILRMPSALHEFFIAQVVDAFDSKIKGLAAKLEESGGGDDAKIATELRKLSRGGSTTLELRVPRLENSSQESTGGEERVVRRSPDATFWHPSQPDYPTLVLEVSYSQQKKDLPRLAESYIIDSSHAIRAVVGLKLPYGQARNSSKAATYSVWLPCVEFDEESGDAGKGIGSCAQAVADREFRNSSKTVCDGSLKLTLSDIIPEQLPSLQTVPLPKLHQSISIPHSELAAFLAKAEEMHAPSAEARKQAAKQQANAPKRFRKRKRSPSEELSEGREEVYASQEAMELQKDAMVDGEYVETVRRVRRRKVDEEQKVDGAPG